MPEFDFRLVLDKSEFGDEDLDALFEAGCDDGTPSSRDGVASIQFTRDRPDLVEAIRSAVADVQEAGFSTLRVEVPVAHGIALDSFREIRDFGISNVKIIVM